MVETSLQAVMREGLDRYSGSHRLSPRQWQVCHHILDCRTEALGGLGLDCDHCGHRVPHYYACRDRHCPRCQRRASQAWCERQQAAVLPVTYHHLVVTLPHDLNPWVHLHPEGIRAALRDGVGHALALRRRSQTPRWPTRDDRGAAHLGPDLKPARASALPDPGRCLLAPGPLAHPAKSTYLFPVRALSRHLRGGFVSRLRQQIQDGKLPRLKDPAQIGALLDTLMAADWVVYSKPCLTHTETVVDYLARYSHRIALTDGRIVNRDGDRVQLDYKDYRDGNCHKVLTLSGEELLRRFLLHVLPKGFMRIRHFGFLANRCRTQRIEEIRAAIDAAQQPETTPKAEAPAPFDGYPCPLCRQGRLRVTAHLVPRRDKGG